jgi:hypothetical protein
MVEKGNEYGSMNRTDIYMYIIRKDISQYISMLVTKNMFNVVCVLGHKLSVNLAVNCSRVHMHTYNRHICRHIGIRVHIYVICMLMCTYLCGYIRSFVINTHMYVRMYICIYSFSAFDFPHFSVSHTNLKDVFAS